MNDTKPLGHKSYGTIGHLPGSRQGRDDVGINPGQARICLVKPRDAIDRIIVQEKLDGSNVAVANINGQIVAINRAGYTAVSSPWKQHRLFALWVAQNELVFDFLQPGERLAGEWLALAHGTIYALRHAPFVAFDIMRNGHDRAGFDELTSRIGGRLPMPALLSDGPPCSVERACSLLGTTGRHGATEEVEGAVWRVERNGVVDFLAKYVRPSKVDGKYLPDVSGKPAIWLWTPNGPCAVGVDADKEARR